MSALSVMVLSLIGLMIIRVPVAFAMGISSMFYLILAGANLNLLAQYLVVKLDSFTLLAIPFFVLAGELMNRGGISEKLMELAKTLVGHIRGGLAHVNVLTSIILAGMSGSATSDAAMTSRVLVPVMEKQGYPRAYAAAVTAASATIGPIIPPSIPMVLVGAMNELSIGRLFFGGVVPGLLMGGGMMIVIYLQAIRRNFPAESRAKFKEIWKAFKDSFFAILTPVIILGGMMSGFFTPTEAAVIAVIYAFILGKFVYRKLKFKDIPQALLDTVDVTSRIMLLIALAGVFGWILSSEQVASRLADFFRNVAHSPGILMLYLNILMLLMGMFFNLTTLVILLSPILFPLITQFGIDPLHFGVVMVLNLMIGQLTPPIGVLSFVVTSVTDVSLEKFVRETVPLMMVVVTVLLLATYFPALVTFVPDLIMGIGR